MAEMEPEAPIALAPHEPWSGAEMAQPRARVCIVIPCLNEAATIGKVVADFRRLLQDAAVVIIDNGSIDGTARQARSAGARVLRETRRGKGWAVQSALNAVDVDVVVLVDGDDTYPAEAVPQLLAPVLAGEADMVVGDRLTMAAPQAFTPLHVIGNRVIGWILNLCFRTAFVDVLSGYRVLSRRILEDVPLLTTGFEVETELTIQVLERGFVVREIPIAYRARREGSASKLRTFRDGYRILMTIAVLLRDRRPMIFFTVAALASLTVGLAALLVALRHRLAGVEGFLTADLLAATAGLTGVALLLAGLVLNAVNTRFRELAALLQRFRRRDDLSGPSR